MALHALLVLERVLSLTCSTVDQKMFRGDRSPWFPVSCRPWPVGFDTSVICQTFCRPTVVLACFYCNNDFIMTLFSEDISKLFQ